MAKTDWTMNDTVMPADLNLIGEEINAKETPVSAQDKANAAQANAKAYTDALIDQVTADGIPKLNTYPYVLTAVQDQDVFSIPLQTFDADTDTLLVSVNTVLLTPDAYTVTDAVYVDDAFDEAGYITLAEPRNAGDIVYILVMKNVPVGEEGAINGRVLAANSVPQDRVIGLGDALDGKLDLSGGQMLGHLRYPSVELNGAEITKGHVVNLTGGIVNEKIDIEIRQPLPTKIEVEVVGMWAESNAAGGIKRVFNLSSGTPVGSIAYQNSYYTETSEVAGAAFAISGVKWDSAREKYIITIAKRRPNVSGRIVIVVKAIAGYWGSEGSLRGMTFSDVYTTDAATYPEAVADKTIYQSGSNANGRYVRYGDGTQICWIRMSLDFDTTATLRGQWTFPANFKELPDLPTVQATICGAGSKASAMDELGAIRISLNTTWCFLFISRIKSMTNFVIGDNIPLDVIAIGRWK